jgi:flagellar motor switch protein FliM
VGEVLTQSEIEALLAGLPSAGASAPDGAKDDAKPGAVVMDRRERKVRDYNFKSPNKFSRDQLRALQMVHEAFGRHLSTSFAATLRSPVHFDVVSTQQLPYHEFMDLLTSSIL